MIKISLNSFCYLVSFVLVLGCMSCIPVLDPEPCDTPINSSIGVNDTFSIAPLNAVYNVGDKVTVSFVVDNLAKLQSDSSKDFNLFEESGENRAIIYSGLENNQDLAYLISSPTNTIKINYGEEHNFGYALRYHPGLNKYVLELEIIFLTERVYTLEDFTFTLLLGNRPNNSGDNCRYYEHVSSIEINPSISFEVL